MEIVFDGQRHTITADRVQILDMLISTFETAVQKNLELEEANRELAKAKTQLARQAQALEELAIRDELTGLYNRRGFITMAQQQLKIALRTGTPLLLFFIDLDDLKTINDNLGHQAGDQALVAAARILKSTFREADILGRIGGDEFAILAIVEPREHPDTLLNRLEATLLRDNQNTEAPFKISLSTGTAWFDPHQPVSLDDMMAAADNLMYEQKKAKA
jgi:diguanylate cyclase (GGDEF)-like protein